MNKDFTYIIDTKYLKKKYFGGLLSESVLNRKYKKEKPDKIIEDILKKYKQRKNKYEEN